MSANINKDKKNKLLSTSSLCKTASTYATQAHTTDKASSSNKLIRTINHKPNTSSDQHIMLSDKPKNVSRGSLTYIFFLQVLVSNSNGFNIFDIYLIFRKSIVVEDPLRRETLYCK